jgi:hypothetical protein
MKPVVKPPREYISTGPIVAFENGYVVGSANAPFSSGQGTMGLPVLLATESAPLKELDCVCHGIANVELVGYITQ